MNTPGSTNSASRAVHGPGKFATFDAWMAEHPWHARIVPMAVYCSMLAVIDWACAIQPALYPLLYGCQLAVCTWLLLRYRRLVPELTLRFHWLAIPVGLGVAALWIVLGRMVTGEVQPTVFERMPDALRGPSLVMRLAGMALLVPLVEEPFVRSMALRSMHRARPTGWAIVQFVCDLPLIGDALIGTDFAKRAHAHGRIMADEFHANALGRLSLFGVAMSTLLFMSYHLPRDWPGAVVCSLAYCALLAATARKGLGPLVWAHGITNAALWGYVIVTGDWQFL